MTRAKDDRMETEAGQHDRQEATWRDECLRLRAQVASLTASLVFVTDGDGGRFVECPAALSDHLDHLEQRAKGAELVSLKNQRELAEMRNAYDRAKIERARRCVAMRSALEELVALKDIHGKIQSVPPFGRYAEHDAAEADYVRRKPLAWDAARAALDDSARSYPTEPEEVIELHAETLIALAAWCASEGSEDVAAAAAEIRALVEKANA